MANNWVRGRSPARAVHKTPVFPKRRVSLVVDVVRITMKPQSLIQKPAAMTLAPIMLMLLMVISVATSYVAFFAGYLKKRPCKLECKSNRLPTVSGGLAKSQALLMVAKIDVAPAARRDTTAITMMTSRRPNRSSCFLDVPSCEVRR
ncbi:uncharacterized protein [Oscarella lobularis]|uniref:uncharacterized protein n=1 Tax=Oscarella lobularis TaxID=121494 RepID=UPI0033131264